MHMFGNHDAPDALDYGECKIGALRSVCSRCVRVRELHHVLWRHLDELADLCDETVVEWEICDV